MKSNNNIKKSEEFNVGIMKDNDMIGKLIYYIPNEESGLIHCYVTDNKDAWLFNILLEDKDKSIRDITESEYNKMLEIGRDSSSIYHANQLEKNYRMLLISDINVI